MRFLVDRRQAHLPHQPFHPASAYSFILNALFIAGAVWACNDENYALGGILILFEAGWYSGNIYGAANAAHKYNRKIDDDVQKISTHTFHLNEYEVRKTPKASIIFRF